MTGSFTLKATMVNDPLSPAESERRPKLRAIQEVERSLSGYRRFEQVLDEAAVGSDGREMLPGEEWVNGQLLPGDELSIGWVEHIGDVARFAREVEHFTGSKIGRVTGTPSVRVDANDPLLLGDMIEDGTFDTERYASCLERELGGKWQVSIDPRTGRLACLKEAD